MKKRQVSPQFRQALEAEVARLAEVDTRADRFVDAAYAQLRKAYQEAEKAFRSAQLAFDYAESAERETRGDRMRNDRVQRSLDLTGDAAKALSSGMGTLYDAIKIMGNAKQ